MKKLIPLLLSLLLLAGCGKTYNGPTETVWVIHETVYEAYSASGEMKSSERTVYAYDIYGNLAQEMTYSSGDPLSKTDYTYDERGNLLAEETCYLQGPLPEQSNKTEYTYDEQDRLILEVHTSGEDRTEQHYIYDDEANTMTTHFAGYEVVSYYDENGLRLRSEYTGDDSVTVLEYDENGFEIRSEVTDASGTHVTEYTLRPDGEPLSVHVSDSSGTDYTTFYEYDEYGECVARCTQEGDTRTEDFRRLYEYDSQGRPLRCFDLTDGLKVEISRQEYDDDARSVSYWSGRQKLQESIYDTQGREIECVRYDSLSGTMTSRTTHSYRQIQVPAGKEAVP